MLVLRIDVLELRRILLFVASSFHELLTSAGVGVQPLRGEISGDLIGHRVGVARIKRRDAECRTPLSLPVSSSQLLLFCDLSQELAVRPLGIHCTDVTFEDI